MNYGEFLELYAKSNFNAELTEAVDGITIANPKTDRTDCYIDEVFEFVVDNHVKNGSRLIHVIAVQSLSETKELVDRLAIAGRRLAVVSNTPDRWGPTCKMRQAIGGLIKGDYDTLISFRLNLLYGWSLREIDIAFSATCALSQYEALQLMSRGRLNTSAPRMIHLSK
jgi:hypothetical protein